MLNPLTSLAVGTAGAGQSAAATDTGPGASPFSRLLALLGQSGTPVSTASTPATTGLQTGAPALGVPVAAAVTGTSVPGSTGSGSAQSALSTDVPQADGIAGAAIAKTGAAASTEDLLATIAARLENGESLDPDMLEALEATGLVGPELMAQLQAQFGAAQPGADAPTVPTSGPDTPAQVGANDEPPKAAPPGTVNTSEPPAGQQLAAAQPKSNADSPATGQQPVDAAPNTAPASTTLGGSGEIGENLNPDDPIIVPTPPRQTAQPASGSAAPSPTPTTGREAPATQPGTAANSSDTPITPGTDGTTAEVPDGTVLADSGHGADAASRTATTPQEPVTPAATQPQSGPPAAANQAQTGERRPDSPRRTDGDRPMGFLESLAAGEHASGGRQNGGGDALTALRAALQKAGNAPGANQSPAQANPDAMALMDPALNLQDFDIQLGGRPLDALTSTGTPKSVTISSNGTQLPTHQLALTVATEARAGTRRFEIRLDPPEMGRIDVRLEMRADGTLRSMMTVERADTLDALNRDARQIERILQQSGLKLDGAGLQLALGDSGTGQQRFADMFSQQRDGNGMAHGTVRPVQDTDAEADAAIAAGPVMHLSDGAVDIRV